MKRTKYFTVKNPIIVKIWRIRNGIVMYFSQRIQLWNQSHCDSEAEFLASTTIRQITRDQARKLEPKAFR